MKLTRASWSGPMHRLLCSVQCRFRRLWLWWWGAFHLQHSTFNSIILLFLFQFFEVLMIGLQFLSYLNHLEKKINSLQRSKKYYYPLPVSALAWFENVGGISHFFFSLEMTLSRSLAIFFLSLSLAFAISLSLSLSLTHTHISLCISFYTSLLFHPEFNALLIVY